MVVQVYPYHVKSAKQLYDNSPTKCDRKDPKTIAMLVKDGRYQVEGFYAELRNVNNLREAWLQRLCSTMIRIQRWRDT